MFITYANVDWRKINKKLWILNQFWGVVVVDNVHFFPVLTSYLSKTTFCKIWQQFSETKRWLIDMIRKVMMLILLILIFHYQFAKLDQATNAPM